MLINRIIIPVYGQVKYFFQLFLLFNVKVIDLCWNRS